MAAAQLQVAAVSLLGVMLAGLTGPVVAVGRLLNVWRNSVGQRFTRFALLYSKLGLEYVATHGVPREIHSPRTELMNG